MNVLVAPDSFKGSLSAQEFCDVAEKAIHAVDPNAMIMKIPMADGGEGTVDSLVLNTGGKILYQDVTGPLGNKVTASFGILGDGTTAVVEMASASGLPLVPQEKRNPMNTTTYGTGELIKAALDQGCTRLIMGIGGSATNDGGAGMLQALGFKLLNSKRESISFGAKGLLELEIIDCSKRDHRLDTVEIKVACDVNNPLYGPEGASYVYGPQKGATEEMLPLLDQGLQRFHDCIQRFLGKDVAQIPGSGAAGGLGAGLLAFLNGSLESGFTIIQKEVGLGHIFETHTFDLVITGEGQINDQTMHGKLPVGVASLAKKYNLPVIAFVGSIGKGAEQVYQAGIDSIMSIVDGPMSLEDAIANGAFLLEKAMERFMRAIYVLNK
ncbi:MAG: glycerate kinase [Epulopiscium sp.]|nr:glycerate kinase [Candidatus Epulonipiscium sp.]